MRRQIESNEQRDGRILRQGNQNPTVAIYRYVTEGSFDTYMWQTLERKARFINQVMRGRLDVREIEDVGEDVLGFAELKAIASGDPLILEQAKIDAEVERLTRVQRAWQRGHQALRATITAPTPASGRPPPSPRRSLRCATPTASCSRSPSTTVPTRSAPMLPARSPAASKP